MREQLTLSTRLCTARADSFPGVAMRLVGRYPHALGVPMRHTAQPIPWPELGQSVSLLRARTLVCCSSSMLSGTKRRSSV
jgi:hypothetical protein